MGNVRRYLVFIFILLVTPDIIKADDDSCTPAQIRLSLGDLYSSVAKLDGLRLPSEKLNDNQAYLVWQAKSHCDFVVEISDANTPEIEIEVPVAFRTAYSHNFSDGTNNETYSSTAYTVLLTGLNYESSYQYEILNSDLATVAGPYTFSLATPNITEKPKTIILVGDTDNTNKGNMTLDRIRSNVAKSPNSYAGLIHLGDVAYNLEDDNAKRGDNFFNSIQDITANVPFIMTPGNHDRFDHWNLLNFRLRNPLYNITHNQYFSFNLQGIHFVSINLRYYNTAEADVQAKMLDWVKEDLKQANDEAHRGLWPWIVAFTHDPIYCVYNDPEGPESRKCYNTFSMMSTWDEVFHEASVDLVVSGHLHSYERMKPIYRNQSAAYETQSDDINNNNIINPQATMYIVEGVGGNSAYTPKSYKAEENGLFVNSNPGYGTLYTSKTSTGDLTLTYEHHSSETDEVIDFMNIIKTSTPAEIEENHHVVLIGAAISGLIGLIIGIVFLKKWKFGKISEDKILLNSSSLRSSRLRYNRPGERGLAMMDL